MAAIYDFLVGIPLLGSAIAFIWDLINSAWGFVSGLFG